MRNVNAGFTLLVAAGLLAAEAAPPGWFLAGTRPTNYDIGVDQSARFSGLQSSFLKAKADEEGFGTLMQTISADSYRGKRVRLSANVKSESVTRWSGLWMRVDGPGVAPKVLAFDNMQNRPIKGTTDWQRYQVVLDVPVSAVEISLGILLDGPGEVWLNGSDVEIVGNTVATTGPVTSNSRSR